MHTATPHHRTQGPHTDETQGAKYEGVRFKGKFCGMSILHAGEVRIPTNITHAH